jgi:peptide/nickel transport system permease protein
VTIAARAILAAWIAAAAFAPWLAPNAPNRPFADRAYAPPTRVHVISSEGRLRPPFLYAQTLVQPLTRQYADDRSHPVPLQWLRADAFVSSADPRQPLLLLGGDSLGRDLFSRLLHGARLSIALAVVAALGATLVGAVAGALAGYAGGVVDALVARVTEVALVLPALYVLVALRSALPLVLSPAATFVITALILAAVGWPLAARGVRAIVAAEKEREYVEAAIALGASRRRVLFRHLLPATTGFLWTQFALLLPACILAEATLSFAALGFPDDRPSWGTLLQDAANIGVLRSAPWLLAPAVAIFSLVLAVNVAFARGGPLDTAAPAGSERAPALVEDAPDGRTAERGGAERSGYYLG